MRVSREQAAENRERVLETATRMFRERGFDGVGVAEIMQSAGLTHGGFYGQFDSKEALAAESCNRAFEFAVARLERFGDADLAKYLDRYLSESHRDRPGQGCPMPALAGDVPRQGKPVRKSFADGVERFIAALETAYLRRDAASDEKARAHALTTASALVGALVLSRATAKASPQLSREILESVRAELAPPPTASS